MTETTPPVVLVLPGPEPDRPRSLASVQAAGVHADRVLDATTALDRWPPEAELIAFIRPGDRWLPGHLEQHRTALADEPDALMSAARHRRVALDGSGASAELGLRPGAVDPAELSLHCPLEASAAVVRTAALAAEALEQLSRPGGDVALWCACAAAGPIARVDAVTAEVRWDPERHGLDREHRIETLYTLARSPALQGGPAAGAIRRELLARVFLDGGSPPDSFDAATLAGEHDLRELVADLQWVLESQGSQLAAMWNGWPYPPTEREPTRIAWPEDTALELELKAGEWAWERDWCHTRMRRLTAELRERDAYIRRLTTAPERPHRDTDAR